MRRYETFVIRIWIDDNDEPDHGEVRHLRSGTGVRFKTPTRAAEFIEQFVGGKAYGTSNSPTRERSNERLS